MLAALILMNILLAPQVSVAEEPLSVIEIAGRLQEKYEKTTSIKADFIQRTMITLNKRERRGSGSMIIQKPGKMRWDYTLPAEQVVLCDGEKIYMYFAKERQMVVAPASGYIESDVTYSFFSGSGDLLRDFDVFSPDKHVEQVSESKGEITREDLLSDDQYLIKLVPKKPHPQVDFIHAWLFKDTFLINRLQIVDLFGSITDFHFTRLEVNVPVDADAFEFTPPPGTEIIEN
ncbi:outer membrane lipoprotein carrier protein LolA [Thermodesulfobacteriota bacterium]